MDSDMDVESIGVDVSFLGNEMDDRSSSSIVFARSSPMTVNHPTPSGLGERQNGRDSIVELEDTVASGIGDISSDSVFNSDQNVTPVKIPMASNVTPEVEFKTPTSVRRALGMAPSPRTPGKARGVKSATPSPSTTPTKIEDELSPYKCSRPNYLPKNVKLHKKKTNQRRENLEIIRRVESDLTRTLQDNTPLVTQETTPKVIFDTIGTELPLLNVFQPERYFVNFDETSLRVSDYVGDDSKFATVGSTDDLKELLITLEWDPFALTNRECRYLTYLLTVTSDPDLVESGAPLVRDKLSNGSFFLGWNDLKKIIVNFGLTDCATLFREPVPTEKPPPCIWNLEFLYSVVQLSFPRYATKKVMRMLSFLVDSFFEQLLVDIHWQIGSLVRQVAEYLISKSVSPCDLASVFNRDLFSMVHNRFIISFLASEPRLETVMKIVALRTVGSLLEVPAVVAESCSLDELLDLMTTEKLISLNAKEATQLLFICEKLCIMSGDFDPSNRKLAERLSELAKVMHQNFKHVDALYLCQAAMRFDAFLSGFRPTTLNT